MDGYLHVWSNYGSHPGLVLCIIQQRFGVLMPGNFTVSSYPVDIQAADILVILAGTAVVGFFDVIYSARSIRVSAMCLTERSE